MEYDHFHVVYLNSDAKSLHQLSIAACDLHLNCGQIISDIVLPLPAIHELCKYGNITVGVETRDLKVQSYFTNRSRLPFLRASSDFPQLHERFPETHYQTDIVKAASYEAAAAAVHALDTYPISMTIDDVCSHSSTAIDCDGIAVTTNELSTSHSDLLAQKTGNVQYLCAYPQMLNKLLSQGCWNQLETLQLHMGREGDGESSFYTRKIIRVITQLKSMRNLSIQHCRFDYPYSALFAIVHKLPSLKRLDVTFSNFVNVTYPRMHERVHMDDMRPLWLQKRHAVDGTWVPGLIATRRPLEFFGAFGSWDGTCVYDSEDERGTAVSSVLFYSKRSTSCRTMKASFRSCCYYSPVGSIFRECVVHFMKSLHAKCQQLLQKLYQISIETVDALNPTRYVHYRADMPVSFELLDLYWFAPDRQQRNAVVFHQLGIMRNLMMAHDPEFIVGSWCCRTRDLQSRRESVWSQNVVEALRVILQHSCTGENRGILRPVPGRLDEWTLDAPELCRTLVGDKCIVQFSDSCKEWIRIGIPEYQLDIYRLLGNICEVVECCFFLVQDSGLFEQILRDCQFCEEATIKVAAARILCWILVYHQDAHPFVSLNTKEVVIILSEVFDHSESLRKDYGYPKIKGYPSLTALQRLLSSNIPPVVTFALRELYYSTRQSDDDNAEARRHSRMVLLEGLLPSILSVICNGEMSNELNRTLAAEVLEAVDDVIKPFKEAFQRDEKNEWNAT